MGNAITITAACLAGSIIIWMAEKNREKNFNYTLVPFGALWIASNCAFIAIPAIAKSIYGVSPFHSRSLANLSLGRQTEAISIGIILFSIGIFTYSKAIVKTVRKDNQKHISKRIKRTRIQIKNAARTHANELGFIAISTSIAGIFFEAHTRFSSYLQEGIISKAITASMIREVSSNAFVFASIAALTHSHENSGKKEKITTTLFLFLILCIDVKTGSRSILLAHLSCLFCGAVIFKKFKKNQILKISAIALCTLLILIPAGETLRIARSKATFFRDDPIYGIKTIAASTDFRVNVESLVTHNRRNEFSDAAFLDQSTCKELLRSEKYSQANRESRESKEIERCIDHAESNIGFHDIWETKTNSNDGGVSQISDKNRWNKNILLLGFSQTEISKGETLNLYADLFQRGSLQAVGLWFLLMGISAKALESLITNATCRVPPIYGYMLASTPLFILNGSASYNTEFFIFGFPKLIIKLIAISVVTAGITIFLKKLVLKLDNQA